MAALFGLTGGLAAARASSHAGTRTAGAPASGRRHVSRGRDDGYAGDDDGYASDPTFAGALPSTSGPAGAVGGLTTSRGS